MEFLICARISEGKVGFAAGLGAGAAAIRKTKRMERIGVMGCFGEYITAALEALADSGVNCRRPAGRPFDGKTMLEIGICSYSFHRLLSAGKQDMFAYIQDCKKLGCTQLDPCN